VKGFGPGLIVLDENYRRQAGAVDLVILCAKLERLAAMTFGLVFVELLFPDRNCTWYITTARSFR